LSAACDIKDFYEIILEDGSMPVSVFQNRVSNWIEETRKSDMAHASTGLIDTDYFNIAFSTKSFYMLFENPIFIAQWQ